MLKLVKPTEHTTHQDVKNDLLEVLHALDPSDAEYDARLDQYKKLCEIEAINAKERTGIKAWIPAIGNVAGILTMGILEIKGPAIFTSKAVTLFGGKLLK
jgi:hypothetical protein